MKKAILGILLLCMYTVIFSQGLEDIIVEEIPVTASATSDDPNLKAGAVAYRVFADLAPNYEIQAVFSLENHEMIFNTTTSFYNNSTFGTTNGKDILNALLALYPSLAFDSYITLDAASNTRLGILRSEDINDGTVDGLVAGTALPLQTVGADFSAPFGTAVFSGKFSTFEGIYNVVGGEQGATAANRVLLGQFTTDGDFNFELNIQIRQVGSTNFEQYVAKNPVGEEILFPKLIYSSAGSVVPPVISLTSPSNGASFNSGESLPITATASDGDGTISLVEFYINGSKVGEDASAPYQYTWTTLTGAAQITARATDNQGNQTTSSPVSVTVAGQPVPPAVSITSPANGASFNAGAAVSIAANASDADGTVTKVEFFVNGTKAGEDLSAPYQYTWTAVSGSAQLTAVATDNSSSQTTSATVSITVTGQPGGSPSINITSPVNGANVAMGTVISITANASDPGGTVTLVEFYVNGNKVGEDATAPYQFSWTAVNGSISLTARATDNEGNKTLSSAVSITVGSNAAPTVTITSPVTNSTFPAGTQVNIAATATDSDGTITLVEFFRNGEKIGEDATSPYQFTWNSVAGISVLTANATDNNGLFNSSPQVLITISGSGGTPPVVNITAPANGTAVNAGSTVNIAATATDADGTVTLVEFFRNGSKIGEDNSSPYSINWTSTPGTANLAAKATDNSGNQTTSAFVSITVNGTAVNSDTLVFDFSKAIITNNHYQLPVSIISGRDVTSFSFSTVINTAKIVFDQVINHTNYLLNTNTFDQTTKKLTINSSSQQSIEKNKKLISVSFTLVTGAITPSDLTQFQAYVNNEKCAVKLILTGAVPVPPTASITAPAGGASFNAGSSIPVTAVAADADGTVSLVEFYVNGSRIGEDATAPYQVNWIGMAGTASITAVATDNQGNQATSAPVSITVTGSGNQLPVVTITAPVNNNEFFEGTLVSVTANASDADGTVARVEFYVNDTKIGKDGTAPYQINWTSVSGNKVIKVIAVDNKGAQSLPATVNVTVNAQPVVNITSPLEGAEFTAGQTVTFIAGTQGGGGGIVLVEFFVNGIKVGQDDSSPYQYSWISLPGQAKISALVTDAKGAKTTSGIVTISVNAPPVVEVVKPAEGSKFLAGETIGFEATATDPDGSVARVEFFVNGSKIGEDLTAPYQVNWTGVEGSHMITAVATDNKGAKETSYPVSIIVVNPYELGSIMQPCSIDDLCVPLKVTDPVSDVIGYDLVMKYNASKVIPSGVITLFNDLINPDLADYGVKINPANGTITISVFLKSSAPEGTSFHGTGKLLCVEFTKSATFNTEDTVEISVTSLSESYFTGVVPKSVKPCEVITYKDYNLNGALKFWSDNSPIAYDINNPGQYLITDISGSDPSTCAPGSAVKVQPDLSGMFRHDVRNGQGIIINRDILPASEVQAAVNGMDAQLTMKVMLGDAEFIPSAYQMLAMDVNMDGVISSGDISQINQRSILMIKEFKQAWNYNNQGIKIVDKPSKDWLFVNEKTVASDPGFKVSSTYPEPNGTGFTKLSVPEVPECLALSVSNLENCPEVEPETFMSIMLGDVNGNYGTVPADGKLKKAGNATADIVFDLSHSSLIGTKLQFPVYFQADYNVTSLDFQLKFNEEKMAFDTINNQATYMEPTFFYNPEDSILRFTSYSLSSYDADQNLIYISFDVTAQDISAGDFEVPKAWLNGDRVSASITEYLPTALPENKSGYEVEIYPNPANDYIHVEISEDATLEIIDLNGRVVSEANRLNARQKQLINVESLSNGIYILNFKLKDTYVMKKLIINK